jgi:hypothetical protein
MGPRGSHRPIFRDAIILCLSLVLANCATAERLPPAQVPTKIITPSTAQEIPLQDPVVDLPITNEPQAPQVASNLPRPRPPAVRRPPTNPQATKPALATPALPAAPEPDTIVPVMLSELVGFDFPSVLQVLKKPDMIQNSALSIVWIYSKPDCMLQLFFYPDIQTRVFHLLKYDLKDSNGEKPNDSSACMRHMMVRNDEPAIP